MVALLLIYSCIIGRKECRVERGEPGAGASETGWVAGRVYEGWGKSATKIVYLVMPPFGIASSYSVTFLATVAEVEISFPERTMCTNRVLMRREVQLIIIQTIWIVNEGNETRKGVIHANAMKINSSPRIMSHEDTWWNRVLIEWNSFCSFLEIIYLIEERESESVDDTFLLRVFEI